MLKVESDVTSLGSSPAYRIRRPLPTVSSLNLGSRHRIGRLCLQRRDRGTSVDGIEVAVTVEVIIEPVDIAVPVR